jgi:hypothetical protein
MSLDCDVAQDIKRDFAVQCFDCVYWVLLLTEASYY